MKKKKVPRAVQAQQQAPKLNPFELKGSRKKFDVLGKRDKKEKNNVIKSREEAYNRVRQPWSRLPPSWCQCCCCCCRTPAASYVAQAAFHTLKLTHHTLYNPCHPFALAA